MKGIREQHFTVGTWHGVSEYLDVGSDLDQVDHVLDIVHLEDHERAVRCVDHETHCDPFWAIWDMGGRSPRLVWILSIHSHGTLIRDPAERMSTRCLAMAYLTSGSSPLAACVFAEWRKAGIDPADVSDASIARV